MKYHLYVIKSIKRIRSYVCWLDSEDRLATLLLTFQGEIKPITPERLADPCWHNVEESLEILMDEEISILEHLATEVSLDEIDKIIKMYLLLDAGE